MQGAGIVWLDSLEEAWVGYVPTYRIRGVFVCRRDGLDDLDVYKLEDRGVDARRAESGFAATCCRWNMGAVYEVQFGSEMACQTGP